MKFFLPLLVLSLLLHASRASALVILQYHHISDQTPASTSTTPARFARHLELIEQSGYTVVSLAQVLDWLQGSASLPEESVLISFDDAYESVYSQAHSLLRSRGWPYVVFVNAGAVDEHQRYAMHWPQLKTLAREGAAIANHSYHHAHLTRRLPDETEAQWQRRIQADIERAEQRIAEQTGHSWRALAYPYGEFDQPLQALLERMGYVGLGQQSGPAAERDRWALARFPMGGDYGDDKDFLLKLNTRVLPFAEYRIEDEAGKRLRDGHLSGPSRPRVGFLLDDSMGTLNCFASGQGQLQAQAESGWLWFQPPQPLSAGRARINCTAPAGNGRFFWHSTPFLVPNADGSWPKEP